MTDRRNRRRRIVPPQFHQQYAPVPQPFYQAPVPFGGVDPIASVRTLADKNATVANVGVAKRTPENYEPPEYEFKASGSSKREQGDRYDERAGELMALGRAYVRLGRELLHAGSKRTQEVLAAQAAELAALEEKRSTPKQPVHRRTREEWEAMTGAARSAAGSPEEWVEMQRSAGRTVLAGEDGLAAFSADLSPEDVSRIKGYQEAGVVPRRRISRDGVRQMADNLGLTLEQEGNAERLMAVARALPLPEHRHEFRVELSHGRYLTIEDGWLVIVHPTGNHVPIARV